MNNVYLLEIGVEELPAKQMTSVMVAFKKNIETEITELPYEKLNIWYTPRRIVIYIEGISEKLPDESLVIFGPNAALAYNGEEPTPALLGFLKKNGAKLSDVIIANNNKGDFVTLHKTNAGVESKKVICQLAANWVTKANFNKAMRWRDYKLQFSRPIRWICSMYNNEHIPIAIEGLSSGVTTRGHRTLANESFEIHDAREYLAVTNAAKVMVMQDKRKESILSQISKLEKSHGIKAQQDEDLLDEIVNIVEYPTVFAGHFDREFLHLPEPIVVTPMKGHQRYFATYNENKELTTTFFAVRNGDDFCIDTVTKGNEKVLRARLKDAQFFYNEDRKKRLCEYTEGLKDVLYQAKLGTVHSKMLRIDELSKIIAVNLNKSNEFLEALHRSVFLCKADLNTCIVTEFDELQGIIGGIYAKEDGEPSCVSAAIESHYLPRFFGDALPKDEIGKIISVADKIDSLIGFYAIGQELKSNKDPFGLRRMMIGILSIVMSDSSFIQNIEMLLQESIKLLSGKASKPKTEILSKVKANLIQRLKVIMADKGYSFSVVDANIDSALSDVHGFITRCAALESYDSLKLAFITTNVLRPIKLSASIKVCGDINQNLFTVSDEINLHKTILKIIPKIQHAVAGYEFNDALDLLFELACEIEKFLENVMVMSKDEAVKQNRIQLMKMCADITKKVCDFEKLQ